MSHLLVYGCCNKYTQSEKYKTFSFWLEASSELLLPFLYLQSDVLQFIL